MLAVVLSPSLSGKAIKQISASLCDLDASLVSDDALNMTKKNSTVGGVIGRGNPP